MPSTDWCSAVGANHYTAGTRPSRIAEAAKQLSIVLEATDLEAEPVLAEAVTEAVLAVDRAAALADGADGRSPAVDEQRATASSTDATRRGGGRPGALRVEPAGE